MSTPHVTIREQQVDGQTVWTETSVGRALLKSAPAKVTRTGGQYRIVGAAWGAPIAQVEVQIDDGPWLPATIDQGEDAEFAWKLWSLELADPAVGEACHNLSSKGRRRVRPAGPGRSVESRQTHLLGEQRAGDTPHPHHLTPASPGTGFARETTPRRRNGSDDSSLSIAGAAVHSTQ
jgi:hypothetical protein